MARLLIDFAGRQQLGSHKFLIIRGMMKNSALILSCVAACYGTCLPLRAHPAHAEPVNYPYVVGFERFHSSLDDDEYLAQGGLILLNELNCVACHAPPASLAGLLPGVLATNLDGVASRMDPTQLELFIRNPRFLKRDTLMPGAFAGPDRDLAEVTALKHYLMTLREELPDYPTGDVDAGRRLYHRIGCAACHAPEIGYRPDHLAPAVELEMTGLPSVPMNLADIYSLPGLTHFLLDPLKHRPSGRMPDFHLTVAEAADLAAYLKAGPGLVLPETLTQAMQGDGPFLLDPLLAKTGESLFFSKNCVACHLQPGKTDRDGDRDGDRVQSSLPLESLNPKLEMGCFAERSPGGSVPYFGLDVVQKRAIAAALVRLKSMAPQNDRVRVDWQFKLLNCYACHERGGTGGTETSREVYFASVGSVDPRLGRAGFLPPNLDRVGDRLTVDWLERIFTGQRGGGRVRPYLDSRMPLYKLTDTAMLPRLLADIDDIVRSDLPPSAADGFPAGEVLPLAKAKGSDCLNCHQLGGVGPSDWPGFLLDDSKKRLRSGSQVQHPYGMLEQGR
jgi:mono/diheme cytochrome c family protein